jgi:hypothetical protein
MAPTGNRSAVDPRVIRVEIIGHDLPGRSCGPTPHGGRYENIHAGIRHRQETIELVPGDAHEARWTFDVTVRRTPDGLDFGGPFVAGDRDDRHLGVRWVVPDANGAIAIFRAAKLRLVEVETDLVEAALASGRTLTARVHMTDEHGWPRCARVRPPAISWSVAD